MKLQTLDLAALYFPRKEWRWLRVAVRPQSPAESPDAFLWAAKVEGRLWAWHPSGADLEQAQGTSQTRVLELETDGSELAAHGLFLKTIFSATPAHDVEWVAALQTLGERFRHDPASQGLPPYWAEALRACGLEAHLGILASRGRFIFLNEQEERLVFERRWDLASLELLETAPAAVRAAFIDSARKWNLTAAQAKEALNHSLILAKKISEKSALSVLGGSFNNAEEFRTALFRTAQPELATLSQRRIQMLRDLNLPPRSSVYGDPSFESDVLKITHNPRKPLDFERFKQWVTEPETTEKIKALLEIYQ